MLKFNSDPPEDPRGTSLPLVRCPTMKAISGIILSDDLIGTNTHFYRGRTLPCDDGNCPACTDGFPWRWHAYLALYGLSSNRVVLFEMTAKATEPLILYRKAYGTLRGCHLTAKRANSSPNSRVIITTKRADLQATTLPDAPNVISALSIIWNIESPSISVEGINRGAQALTTTRNLNLRANLPPTSTTPSLSPSPNGNGSSPD